jgi:hypothetical protein
MDDWVESVRVDGDRMRMDVDIGRMVDVSEVVVPSLSGMNGKSTCSWQEREARGIRVEGYMV